MPQIGPLWENFRPSNGPERNRPPYFRRHCGYPFRGLTVFYLIYKVQRVVATLQLSPYNYNRLGIVLFGVEAFVWLENVDKMNEIWRITHDILVQKRVPRI